MTCEDDLFQAVRLVDVFVLGPVMVSVGMKTPGLVGKFLTVAGVLTVVFNGLTFLDIAERRR